MTYCIAQGTRLNILTITYNRMLINMYIYVLHKKEYQNKVFMALL